MSAFRFRRAPTRGRFLTTLMLAAAAAPSLATAQVDVTITTDNAYSFGFGTAAGIAAADFHGSVENLSAGAIFNCAGGPESYPAIPVVAGGYLYIVAWSDNSVTQGVLGQFLPAGTNTLPFYTGNASWQVFATGIDYGIGGGGPGLAEINAQILLANANGGGTGSSVGWVGVGNNAAPLVGALAIGEANDSATGDFPIVCNSAIGADARWMWYDPAPGTTPNPFRGNVAGEFLIFRLATQQAVHPRVVHLNKDLINTTSQVAAGVEILVAGSVGQVADLFLGPATNFAAVASGADTSLRWTGGVIAPGQLFHIGFTLLQADATIRGMWLLDAAGNRIGCVHQLNGDVLVTAGGGIVRFADTVTDCESIPLFAGQVQLEWFGNEIPLAHLNASTPRFPLRVDNLTATGPIAPGATASVTAPAPPAGATFVVLSFVVAADAALSAPVTRDWYEFSVDEVLVGAATSPTPYGLACPATGAIVEQFRQSNPMDLAGASLRFSSANLDCTVSPGSGFDASYAPGDALALPNTSPLLNLPLGPMVSFPFGLRHWTTVDVSARGLMRLGDGVNVGPFPISPSLGGFTNERPSLAAAWGDWRLTYPGGSGTFYWTTTPTHCMATWVNVREVSGRFLPSTFQIKLFANGDLELNYGPTVDPDLGSSQTVIAGVGMGRDPLAGGFQSDLSSALTAPFTEYLGAPRLVHRASAPPVLGTTVRLSCSEVPDGSLGGLFVIGFTGFGPFGIDLTALGMPSCAAYTSIDMLMFGNLTGSVLTYDLGIPSDVQLAGLSYFTQALTVTPGHNSFGGFASNGVASGLLGG